MEGRGSSRTKGVRGTRAWTIAGHGTARSPSRLPVCLTGAHWGRLATAQWLLVMVAAQVRHPLIKNPSPVFAQDMCPWTQKSQKVHIYLELGSSSGPRYYPKHQRLKLQAKRSTNPDLLPPPASLTRLCV